MTAPSRYFNNEVGWYQVAEHTRPTKPEGRDNVVVILTGRDGAVAREVEEERGLLLRKLARLFHTGRGICLGTHRRRAAS